MWNRGESFTDTLNGKWDIGEKFIDTIDSLNFERNLAGVAELKNRILSLVPVSSASTVTDIISMQPDPNPYEAFDEFVSLASYEFTIKFFGLFDFGSKGVLINASLFLT